MNQILRSFINGVLTFILILSLILFVLSLSLFQFTSYQNLHPKITSIVEQQFSQSFENSAGENILDIKTDLIESCKGITEINLPLNENNVDLIKEIKINCSEISNEITAEQFLKISSEKIFEAVYYKDYDCSFINCVKKIQQDSDNMFIFASSTANKFFKTTTIILGFMVLLSILLLILTSQPKYSLFYALTPGFIIPGLLFLTKNPLSGMVQEEPAKTLISSLANSLFINYMVVFVIGTIFLIIGIVIRISKYRKQKNQEKKK